MVALLILNSFGRLTFCATIILFFRYIKKSEVKMGRIFFAILLAALSLKAAFWDDYKIFAKYMHYHTDYQKALTEAKRVQKPLFMVVVTDGCPFCERLMDRILTKDYVREYIAQKYVTLIMNKEQQKVPKRYLRPFEPVTYIIDPSSEQIIDEIDGYMEEEHYLWHL